MYKLTIIPICFFLFIIWIIYLANTGQQSIFFDLVRLIPYGDKFGHLGLSGTLTLLANFASKFKVFKLGKVNVFWGTTAIFVFVTAEVLSQHFMPTRTLDIYDYTADMVGILFFTWLSSIFAKKELTGHCN